MQHFVEQHNFAVTPQVNIPRSVFNRSRSFKTTFNSGYLVPFFVDEALPGDTMNLTSSNFVRLLSPLDYPIMDNMWLETFYFAVPLRLVWEHWKNFNGEQKNPGDSTDYICPKIKAPTGGFGLHSLADYFGINPYVENIEINAFWHRAYNLIYNEWFRDENLIDSLEVPTGDGPDDVTLYPLQRRGKRHDYFTSCLPWPQKGVAVEIPLGKQAPVLTSSERLVTGPQSAMTMAGIDGTTGSGSGHWFMTVSKNSGASVGASTFNPTSSDSVHLIYPSNLYADLSEASAATINSLREAFAYQTLFERDARGGSRYTEIIRSHFGVISPDARLQRPEYLGGSSDMIDIQTVVQNSQTTETSPQGSLSAFAMSTSVKHGFVKSFTEHCVVLGLLNVRADLTYQQGIPRMFSRNTRFDFYWPALSNLGEQAVLNKEIYAQGTDVDNDVFGYQERWSEYRYSPSIISGKLRSQAPQSLDLWHLSQKFDSLPTLSKQFIEETPPIDRVIAVTDEPEFILDNYIKLIHARPMPTYSIPGVGRYV